MAGLGALLPVGEGEPEQRRADEDGVELHGLSLRDVERVWEVGLKPRVAMVEFKRGKHGKQGLGLDEGGGQDQPELYLSPRSRLPGGFAPERPHRAAPCSPWISQIGSTASSEEAIQDRAWMEINWAPALLFETLPDGSRAVDQRRGAGGGGPAGAD